MECYRSCETMDRFATPEKIADLRSLAHKSKKLADEVALKARHLNAEDWYEERGYPLKSILKLPPYQTLCELAEYFDACAQDLEEERTLLTSYVGKPGAEDAKRVFAIRLFSESIRRAYGQPLHNVVALTCSFILGDPIDPDLVRKLVKTGEKLPPYYWSG